MYFFFGFWYFLVMWWYCFIGGFFDLYSYDDLIICIDEDDEWDEVLEKYDGYFVDVF